MLFKTNHMISLAAVFGLIFRQNMKGTDVKTTATLMLKKHKFLLQLRGGNPKRIIARILIFH